MWGEELVLKLQHYDGLSHLVIYTVSFKCMFLVSTICINLQVSSDCHTRDQLTQLLEEKDSLQKEQQERIRTLAEMMVTSSSFLQEQELKVSLKNWL